MNEKTESPESPLDELILDHNPAADEEVIAKILKPYARLYRENKEVVLNEHWSSLNLQKKILVFLIGRKALRLKGIIDEDEEKLTPSEIAEATRLKAQSVRPTLLKLAESQLVKVDKDTSKYAVPDWAVPNVNRMMSEE